MQYILTAGNTSEYRNLRRQMKEVETVQKNIDSNLTSINEPASTSKIPTFQVQLEQQRTSEKQVCNIADDKCKRRILTNANEC